MTWYTFLDSQLGCGNLLLLISSSSICVSIALLLLFL